ncbi:MAG: hypothetical protein Q9185_002662 [Variospora sp. 1 TL-2023]
MRGCQNSTKNPMKFVEKQVIPFNITSESDNETKNARRNPAPTQRKMAITRLENKIRLFTFVAGYKRGNSQILRSYWESGRQLLCNILFCPGMSRIFLVALLV